MRYSGKISRLLEGHVKRTTSGAGSKTPGNGASVRRVAFGD